MDRILRSLHIGVGNRGRWPLEQCKPEIGYQPAALCDPDSAMLAAAREMTGLDESQCYTDPATAMKQPGLDCVVICAPTQFHVPLTKLAMEHGLPALVEKGMAPDFPAAVELVKAVEQAKQPVCVAQNYRYTPLHRTFKNCLTDESHPAHPGHVHSVTYIHHRVRPEPRTLTWPFSSIWDMSCHHFDNLLDLFGAVDTITAQSYAMPGSAYPHDNNTAALMRFANGTFVTYEHGHDAARTQLVLCFHGRRGALWHDNNQVFFCERPTEQFGSCPPREVPLVEGTGTRGVLADFHRYVCQGVEPGISARNNLEVMAMCHMMVESIRSQQTISRTRIDAAHGTT